MGITAIFVFVVLISGAVNSNTPVPLSEYVEVPGKFVAPIPKNSITIVRDVSLQLCAAKCTLAFRMKTFPCYAFEYTPGSRMCVHTNVTTLVVNGGYLGLKNNPAVNYYERSKASYSNLFQSLDHSALKQQNTYFDIQLNTSLEQCAYECMRNITHTCMSFSHSPSTGACGLSNVFYGAGHSDISLIQSQIYNHYQYYTSWPCNATLPENYVPRALASLRFPYQSIRNVHCHVKIVAPSGKQIQILFPTVYFSHDVCHDNSGVGLTVYDGESASGSVLGHYCHSSTDRSRPPLLTSTSGSLYVTYTTDDVPLAFESIYQFVTVDPCASNKCTNGATCLKTNSSYVCECPSGFAGQFCEVDIDECASSPCLFNGQCLDQVNGFTCNCTTEFTGSRCEKFIGACASNPCVHGTCVITSRYNYTCNCEAGYVGEQCETKFTPCMSNPCQHGLCSDRGDDYVCACSAGFIGRNCDRLAIDLCTFSPCKNGGRCSSTANLDILCSCPNGFGGKYCESRLNYCENVNCNNGSCRSNGTGYICQCNLGFKGQHCDVSMSICEIHDKDCHPGHCYPFANVPEGYVCWCPDNKYHRYCNQTTDPCTSSPCQHGTCHRNNTGYICRCSAGYDGVNCSIPTCAVAECGLGLCEDTKTGYNCICPVGYSGLNCEVRLATSATLITPSPTDNCLSLPCQHNATCLNKNNSYTCICPEGWTGRACDVRSNACASNPCINGSCVSSGLSYRCVSKLPNGHQTSTCDTQACKNGGTCVQTNMGILCKCPIGFRGTGCDVKYDACADYPCPSGLCQIHENMIRCVLGALQGVSNTTSGLTIYGKELEYTV